MSFVVMELANRRVMSRDQPHPTAALHAHAARQ